jgi:hypothetical protein
MPHILRTKHASKKAKTAKKASNRQPPKPRTVAEPTPQQNFEFISDATRAQFSQIKSYKVIQVRVFDLVNLMENPKLDSVIRGSGWKLLNRMVHDKTNKTMTLEFYVNARNSIVKYELYVRGKIIDYSLDAINRLLDLTHLRSVM